MTFCRTKLRAWRNSRNWTSLGYLFAFRLRVDQKARELHRKNWELMVEQRNHLVHHFLDRITPNTLEAFFRSGQEKRQLLSNYVQGNPEPIRSSFDDVNPGTWVIRLLAQVKSIDLARSLIFFQTPMVIILRLSVIQGGAHA